MVRSGADQMLQPKQRNGIQEGTGMAFLYSSLIDEKSTLKLNQPSKGRNLYPLFNIGAAIRKPSSKFDQD